MLYRVFCGLVIMLAQPAVADTAQSVFNNYQDALIQVQVIENQTQRKSAIGSGFYVSDDLLITNYHVIAEKIQSEQQYQLMANLGDDNKQQLQIIAVDVINDLALLRTPQKQNRQFTLASNLPAQGEQVFSLGNPHDLGMVVVPGTFNGMKQQSFYPRLHVTGSINPGMSGGPSVNSNSEVIGVNVATAGNQIGFVVPVAQVNALLAGANSTAPEIDTLKQQILQQLLTNQQQMLSPMLSEQWQMQPLGKGLVPADIAPFVQCWGHATELEQNNGIDTATASCGQSEQIYLNSGLTTGKLEMQFEWLDGKDLSPLKFNHHYQNRISYSGADNRAGKHDVTGFNCHSDIVAMAGKASRVIFCVRAYKEYPQLFDALYLAATVADGQQGFISHFTLAGVTQENATAFARKFMEAVVWQS
ncbi:MAG: serine protease [Rheinheimera sp.]|uniref:S1C family serine protease n=1 Tax=Arsukibacterium sp. UBA3155 TaxID=1946058 RepID=UPI000C914FD7|nr:serine protease [Arsukibacterium sp. UBA3155]MAD73546.1 serine protease [Rheinheimera sp.]